jgi:hypothetical protein
VFGHLLFKENEYVWDRFVAEEQEVIVGISVCFEKPGYYNGEAKMWSHWTVKHVGVMVQSLEDFDREACGIES